METYKEIAAESTVSNFIDCFWYFKPEEKNDIHRVTPDNRVDLLFEDDGKVYFSGPMTTYSIAQNRDIFGIRFRPEYIYSLFQIPLSEFQDETIDLGLFYKETGFLADLRESSKDFDGFKKEFEKHFACNILKKDNRIGLFTSMIEDNVPLNVVANKIGVTEQHLRRLSKKHLGISPKRFEKIQKIKKLKETPSRNLSLSHLALAGGYFDQSHLNNDCKKLTGLTPKQYFF